MKFSQYRSRVYGAINSQYDVMDYAKKVKIWAIDDICADHWRTDNTIESAIAAVVLYIESCLEKGI